MTETKQFIAVDMGAESCRLMLGTLSGGTLQLAEVHRFANGPIEENGTLRWDFLGKILDEIKRGIGLCVRQADGPVAGVAVDSWGVDFALLDGDGKLVENPYNYRDSRTDGMLDEAFRLMPRREIYEHTGLQFMQLNSLYQLLAMRTKRDPALAGARALVFIADLVSYHLCGKIFGEYTLASTSQMMDMKTGAWSDALLSRLDLPRGILPDIVNAGTIVGELKEEIAEKAGCGAIPVIAVGSHDTASAVAAVPAEGADWGYISSGTWSLMGVELPDPIVNDKTYRYDFTNEGGVEGTIRLLKNISGLWLVQECRRQWKREGVDLSYAQLTDLARKARPFAARIATDHGDFLSPGDMPGKINKYLSETGQEPLREKGEIVRSILECLAFTYRETLDRIEDIIGRRISVVHIVGGGSQNELLSQFAANAMNREIVSGPIEATSIGNVLMQAKALGLLDSLDAVRAVVRNSFPTKRFIPADAKKWDAKYGERRARGS